MRANPERPRKLRTLTASRRGNRDLQALERAVYDSHASIDRTLPPGCRDSTEPRITPQQEIAGVKGLAFEGGAVARNKKPMADLACQKLDGTERREFAAEDWICGIDRLRKNEPNAVVTRRFGVIAKHTHNAVADVDGEP